MAPAARPDGAGWAGPGGPGGPGGQPAGIPGGNQRQMMISAASAQDLDSREQGMPPGTAYSPGDY